MPGHMWAAGLVKADGSTITGTGQVGFTSARLSGCPTGVCIITFASTHPLGANYTVNVTAQGKYFRWISKFNINIF